jgi:hypothetical protein
VQAQIRSRVGQVDEMAKMLAARRGEPSNLKYKLLQVVALIRVTISNVGYRTLFVGYRTFIYGNAPGFRCVAQICHDIVLIS